MITSPPLTLAALASITGARLSGVSEADALRLTVTGPVVADSRAAAPGGLFVADAAGHDFAGDAIARGAVAVLASRELPGLPTLIAPPTAYLNQGDPDSNSSSQGDPGSNHPERKAVVDRDASVIALGKLAHYVLAERLPDITTVAVTGSSGKTSTKDLLAAVFGAAGPTIAPDASLNDELGMPLTVLRADEKTRFLVLEMGARGIGHLTYLTSVARPDIAIVLNVGMAHAGGFGGKEAIARAKGELVEGLAADGVAVLNADDPLVREMSARCFSRTEKTKAEVSPGTTPGDSSHTTVAKDFAGRVVLFGEGPDADVRATDITLDEQARPSFRLVVGDQGADVTLRLVGRHHVSNALAVASAGLAAGLQLEAIAGALSEAERKSRWRMEVTELPDGITVVNDGYNANPDSMAAALRAVRVLAGSRRTWAVLGEMLELGDASADEHEAVGRIAAELEFDRVVVVGDGAKSIGAGVGTGSRTLAKLVADSSAAHELLRQALQPNDVVLVKSSRDAGLRYLGDALVRDGLRMGAGRQQAEPAGGRPSNGIDREESTA